VRQIIQDTQTQAHIHPRMGKGALVHVMHTCIYVYLERERERDVPLIWHTSAVKEDPS
jgi:hypothetical protein